MKNLEHKLIVWGRAKMLQDIKEGINPLEAFKRLRNRLLGMYSNRASMWYHQEIIKQHLNDPLAFLPSQDTLKDYLKDVLKDHKQLSHEDHDLLKKIAHQLKSKAPTSVLRGIWKNITDVEERNLPRRTINFRRDAFFEKYEHLKYVRFMRQSESGACKFCKSMPAIVSMEPFYKSSHFWKTYDKLKFHEHCRCRLVPLYYAPLTVTPRPGDSYTYWDETLKEGKKYEHANR